MVCGAELERVVANKNLIAKDVEVKVATPKGNVILLDMTEFYEFKDDEFQSVNVHFNQQ